MDHLPSWHVEEPPSVAPARSNPSTTDSCLVEISFDEGECEKPAKLNIEEFDADDDDLGVDVFRDSCLNVPSPSMDICSKIKRESNSASTPTSTTKTFMSFMEETNLHDGDLEDERKRPRYSFLRMAYQNCSENIASSIATLRRRRVCKLFIFGSALVVIILLFVFTLRKHDLTSLLNQKKKVEASSKGKNKSNKCNATEVTIPPHVITMMSNVTNSTFEDPCTKKYQALAWLIQEREMLKTISDSTDDYKDDIYFHMDWMDPNNQDITNYSWMLFQRYAMALLNMELNGDFAQKGVPVCLWPGVRCVVNTPEAAVNAIAWPNSGLFGTLPEEIGAIARGLQLLDLGENDISGTLPRGLFKCTQLQYLYLHDNNFTGTLSESFANLRRLTELYLGLNQFTGSFPKGLGSGTGSARPMRYLSLHKNQLSGKIPDNINYRFIYWLDLSHNQFTGTLPADWTEGEQPMLHLRHLFLNDNQFTGTIPTSFPRLGNGRIEMFHASNNKLTGTIPGGYHPANFIQSLEFHHNQFEALDPTVCGLIVYVPPEQSELVNLKLDCTICTCSIWCDPGFCYP